MSNNSGPYSPPTKRGLPKNIANLYECYDDMGLEWREKALCRNSNVSTDDFFALNVDNKSIKSVSKAISMCSACPVQTECLYECMKYNYDGVWGGTIYRQRIYFIRTYLDNDLNNLTKDIAKQFVQMAKVENTNAIYGKRKYRRKTKKSHDINE